MLIPFVSVVSEEDPIFSNLANIAVDPETCFYHRCDEDCYNVECQACSSCIGKDDADNMHRAYQEHNRQDGFKRLFPSESYYYNDALISRMTSRNQVSVKWFEAKCREDEDWC